MPRPATAKGAPMTPDEADVLTRKHAELWSQQDARAVAALYRDDCVYEDIPQGALIEGKDEVMKHANGMFQLIPDIRVSLRSVAATKHHSAREYTITGTWAANGKPISLPGVSILEFDGDLIARNTDYYDLSTLMAQVADG